VATSVGSELELRGWLRSLTMLLNLSRINRAPLRKDSISLTEMARSVTAELQEKEPSRKVLIEIATDLLRRGDARLVTVVLVNLLGNAWKFTARQQEAQIAVGQEKKENETVFSVRDNGAGFDMAYADKLFAPFSDCIQILSLKHRDRSGDSTTDSSRVMVAVSGPSQRLEKARPSSSPWEATNDVREQAIFLVEDNDDDAELAVMAFDRARLVNPLVRARDGVEALDYLFGAREVRRKGCERAACCGPP